MEAPALRGDADDAPLHAPGRTFDRTSDRAPGLEVRPVLAADAAALSALREDAEVQRWCCEPTELAPEPQEVQRAWAAERGYALAVDLGGACAGVVGLHPDGLGGAHLRAGLLPWARGRGVGSAACRLLLTWGFAQLGLPVVHWRSPVGDWSSRRLAWACGFSTEGTTADLLPAGDGSRRDAWTGSLRWGEPLVPRGPWLDAVELVGDGVVLDRHVAGDAGRIAQACAAPSTQAWLPLLPSPYTVLDAAAYVASRREVMAAGTELTWAVRERRGGDLVATVGLFSLSSPRATAEVGYWCSPDARERGVTTAAVRAVVAHALTPTSAGGLGLARLELRAAAPNTASRRVAEKVGFVSVGVDREGELLRDGRRVDFVRYDLLARELTPRS